MLPSAGHPARGVLDPARSKSPAPTTASRLPTQDVTAQDVAGEGSDRLIDALVVSGDDAQIRQRFEDHPGGADHVAIQLIAGPDTDLGTSFGRVAVLLALPARELPSGG